MLSRSISFVDRNPVTPVLVVSMTSILVAQIVVADYSIALFEFVFIGQNSITPGLLLAPLSHGTMWTHFLPNMMLLLAVGWPLEDRLKTSTFALFTLVAAYLPTYLQIVYSTVMTGTAGTLGFSGAVYAFPPVLLCLCLRDSYFTNLGTAGAFALGVTIAIPLQVLGLLELLVPSPLPGADVTHTTGYLIGWGYGLFLLFGEHR